MAAINILDALEEEFPVNREVNIEGWPAPVFVWRFDMDQLQELSGLKGSDADHTLWLVCNGIGSDQAAGDIFNNDRGRRWLRTHPMVAIELANVVADFNETAAPSEDRRKKSSNSADSSISAENSESNTPATSEIT